MGYPGTAAPYPLRRNRLRELLVLILHNWWLERGHQMRSLLAGVAPGPPIMKAP
jgi:hypothetical protein